MEFLQPVSLAEALAAKADAPDAVPIAGGTDVMVELNFARRRPEVLLDLNRVPELTGWTLQDGKLRVGAGVTYAELTGERGAGANGASLAAGDLGGRLPGLAMAARTVGSPQIRNRGTIGGNLGSASPAGDCHPSLLAAGAEIEVASTAGPRMIPVDDFFSGVKRSALAADELIVAVWISPPSGPEQFAKIGTRNAMVIAVAAFGLALHPDRKAVGTGIGSAAPTPVRAPEAEEFLARCLDEAGLWESRDALPNPVVTEFGGLVSAAARPIDDVRGTAAYRRHALAVLARRTLTWAWADYRRTGSGSGSGLGLGLGRGEPDQEPEG
jgi:CO/xanthine dehydrogenase FAD-binding subunit